MGYHRRPVTRTGGDNVYNTASSLRNNTIKEKHKVLFDYFDGVLGTTVSRTATLDLAAFHRAGLVLLGLDRPFTEDEAWATIRSLQADRATPGSDGYTGKSIRLVGQ